MNIKGQRQSTNVQDGRRARVQQPTPGQRNYRDTMRKQGIDPGVYPDGQDTKRMAIMAARDLSKAKALKSNPLKKALDRMGK